MVLGYSLQSFCLCFQILCCIRTYNSHQDIHLTTMLRVWKIYNFGASVKVEDTLTKSTSLFDDQRFKCCILDCSKRRNFAIIRVSSTKWKLKQKWLFCIFKWKSLYQSTKNKIFSVSFIKKNYVQPLPFP